MEHPRPLDDHIKWRMETQRTRDTKPEVELRKLLHAAGLRYRVDRPVLPDLRRRRADVVFGPARVAVFVDGCFWHRCPTHGHIPKNNAEWWRAKLQRNVDRDRDTDRRLVDAGWVVLRFWEHDDMSQAAAMVHEVVGQRRLRH